MCSSELNWCGPIPLTLLWNWCALGVPTDERDLAPVLLAESVKLPGSRVLDDGFTVIHYAALVPQGAVRRLYCAPSGFFTALTTD